MLCIISTARSTCPTASRPALHPIYAAVLQPTAVTAAAAATQRY